MRANQDPTRLTPTQDMAGCIAGDMKPQKLQSTAAHLWSNIVRAANNVCEDLAGFVENRQPKVCGLQRRLIFLGRQQEVLRLQVPAPNAKPGFVILVGTV